MLRNARHLVASEINKYMRHKVIDYSVLIEDRISLTLAKLLGIDNYEATKSFGHKSSSLSFNAKLNILLDIDAINNNDKKKLEYFSQIRNQFAHNISVVDFTTCFDRIDGLENKLLKEYSELASLNLSREENLSTCFNYLIIELFVIFSSLYDKIENIYRKKGEIAGKIEAQDSIIKSLSESIKFVTSQIPNGELIGKAIFLKSLKQLNEEIENSPINSNGL